jgi:peptidoglycan hydrolase-like protein with peptidoglycan-binding domain
MWCGFGKSRAAVAITCLVTASVVISDTTLAAHQHIYTPQQFREVLRGLGYKVKVKHTPSTEEETKKAIAEFQKGYRLKADENTEAYAANIVKILKGNLNLVLKPSSSLHKNPFYGAETEAAVKEYQKKNQLQETGIADLALRQKLDADAKAILTGQPTTTEHKHKHKHKPMASPTSEPKPTASPTASPKPTSKRKPMASPKPTSTP